MTSKDSLIIVMAHGAAIDTFRRHLPLWQSHGMRVVVTSPVSDPVNEGDERLIFGHKEHHGHHAIDRFRFILSYAAHRKERWFFIHEYDSICITPELPQALYLSDMLWGNKFSDHPSAAFKGDRFFHPPLFMSREIIHRILAADMAWPEEGESGFWDRWIGRMAQLGEIPCMGYGKLGVGFNTIHDDLIPNVCDAVRNGAVMIHGVKSDRALNAILSCA